MKQSDLPIPSSCNADWDSMTREGRKRFCDACRKHVHDLSSMTQDEAMALVSSPRTEKLCVRYICDAQGNIKFSAPEITAWRRELDRELIPVSHLARAKRVAMTLAAAALPMSLTACMGAAPARPVSPNATLTDEPPTPPTSAGKPLPHGRKVSVLNSPSTSNPVETVEPVDEVEMLGEIAPVHIAPQTPPSPSQSRP
ncbi:MAG: hypothetical protein U0165_16220 [Polyangiaceae bacterium]